MAALEAAAQRLQKRIDEAQSSSMAAPSAATPPSRKISGHRRKEASDVDELVSDFGFLTVNATSRDFHGFTSTMSFAKLLVAAATRKDLPLTESRALPPRYAITPLIEQYLENVYVLFPFFSETEFMGSLSRVYQESSPSSMAMPVDALDVWYVRLVLSIAYASTSQKRGDDNDQAALQHISAAMELSGYVLRPGSITGVQALLLLVQYALVDPEHFDSWYLVGMAARLVVDLGLHCEPSAETKISKDAVDMRRRIFHCTYALDRVISMALDRAFSFSDDSAPDVPLPTLAIETEPGSPSQLFLHSVRPSLFLFDIRRVQSAFYQTTRWSSRSQWPLTTAATYASSVCNDIHAWYATIPTTLSQRHLVFFNLERLYGLILVVSANQKVPATSMTDLNKELVFEYSAQFADQLQPVTQDVSWHAFLTYPDICRAKYVGKQFLDVMWSDFDGLLKTAHIFSDMSSTSSTPASSSSTPAPLGNCQRAITFLRKITEILDFARRRWAISTIREKFEQESAVMLARLQSRQQEFSPVGYPAQVLFPSTAPDPLGGNPYAYSSGGMYQLAHPAQTQNVVTEQSEMHPQQLLTPPEDYVQPTGYNLPQGSLPRRSYEFLGGRR